jgi:hypothetical protein
MSTHTPGPWTADVQYIIRDSNGDEIATCAIAAQLLSARANASVIAAAPDMLAALKGLLAQNLALAHEIKSSDPLWCKWWDQARAAIAKAEGVS